jgi:hypothetical protein
MKPGPTRIRIVVAAVIAVALLSVYGAAGAGAVKRPGTSATLVFKSPNNFSGEVSSGNSRCIAARIVTLLFLGPSGMDVPQFVEAAKTDSSGHYEINTIPDAVEGEYQITVGKRKIRKKGKTLVVCQPFTSVAQRF